MPTKIDANRAAELLTDFMERNRAAFGSNLAGVVLDLRQERLVEQLCRRLAKDPDQVEIGEETPMVRAQPGAYRLTIHSPMTVFRNRRVPKRLPQPIGDAELHARLEQAKPWTRHAAELARLFGLRHGEAFWAGRRHIDRSADMLGLRCGAGETKSGNEEMAWGGEAGSQLLEELEALALERGQDHLITWAGPKKWRAQLRGEPIDQVDWRPLKSIPDHGRPQPRLPRSRDRTPSTRYASYITEVAKVQPAAAQDAARHQDPSTTRPYIKLAASEIRDAVRQANSRRPQATPSKLKLLQIKGTAT